jgi:hypothetical protein
LRVQFFSFLYERWRRDNLGFARGLVGSLDSHYLARLGLLHLRRELRRYQRRHRERCIAALEIDWLLMMTSLLSLWTICDWTNFANHGHGDWRFLGRLDSLG